MGLSSSIHDCKSHFFSSDFLRALIGYKAILDSPNKDKSILLEDDEDYHVLLDVKVPTIKELMTEQTLYDVNISLVLP